MWLAFTQAHAQAAEKTLATCKNKMELLKSVTHPTEFWALLKFQYGGGKDHIMPKVDESSLSSDMKRCLELLNLTSRSFAAVIQALDSELRPAVCIFYLVLRALDTLEDDMSIPVDKKTTLLKQFYTYLYDKDWRFMESTEKDKVVLEEFQVISAEFRQLKPVFQDVIADIAKKMGEGMTKFLVDKVGTMAQWDEYCHYVAGLVGIGLSRLFSASGLEGEEVGKDEGLANSLGLLLQKTNIIRDYLEDVRKGREFWPKEAWSKYTTELTDFQMPRNLDQAVPCLNVLITNALKHVPDVLTYMSRIRNQSVFNFCAIPQTMAVATLAACYNNKAVFSSVVKIRKGQAVDLMMRSNNMVNVRSVFFQYIGQICTLLYSDPTIPEGVTTWELVADIRAQCVEGLGYNLDSGSILQKTSVQVVGVATVIAMGIAYYGGYFVS
ncbi:squalene synthase-like [Halichondria panicea]|uniref:squalene synthase-like n=1 Tax=Halichondria panicea TaxID=6063 RepID=UPI00312B6580